MMNNPAIFWKFQNVFKHLSINMEVDIKEGILLELLGDIIHETNGLKFEYGAPNKKNDKLYLAKDYIYEHAKDKISLEDLMKVSGYSRYHLVRSFKNTFGMSPHAYQIDRRINIAKSCSFCIISNISIL